MSAWESHRFPSADGGDFVGFGGGLYSNRGHLNTTLGTLSPTSSGTTKLQKVADLTEPADSTNLTLGIPSYVSPIIDAREASDISGVQVIVFVVYLMFLLFSVVVRLMVDTIDS